jgi:hypothetical protein
VWYGLDSLPVLMRFTAAVSTCCSLLTAFCLAPFQHVHSHDGHAAEIHAHFFAVPALRDDLPDDPPGAHFDDADDHALATSLDTFTLEFASLLPPFALTRAQAVDPIWTVVSVPWPPAEACAHDPPAVGPSIPRAPPS